MLRPRGRSILPLSRRFSPVPRRLPQRTGAGAAALAAWPHLCLLVVCVAPEEREGTREPRAEAGSWLEGTQAGSTPRRDREARARVLREGRRGLRPLAHTTPFHWWPRPMFPGASIGFSLKRHQCFGSPAIPQNTDSIPSFFVQNKTSLLRERFLSKGLQFVSIYRTEHILSSRTYDGSGSSRVSFVSFRVLSPESSFRRQKEVSSPDVLETNTAGLMKGVGSCRNVPGR